MPELMTLEQFAALPDTGERLELVRGRVRVMAPVHGPAATVASNVVGLLILHVLPQKLGRVYSDNTGFALLGAEHTNRSPDVAFIRADRLPPRGIGPGPIRIAPDLVVEVLSPTETASILEDKLADYRAAGTPLIWVVDPTHRLVTVHPADARAPRLPLPGGRAVRGARPGRRRLTPRRPAPPHRGGRRPGAYDTATPNTPDRGPAATSAVLPPPS